MKPMIDCDTTLPEAFNRMREEESHNLVVERDGDIVGIVSDRDLLFKGIPLRGEVFNPLLTVSEVMTPLPHVLSDESSLDEAVAMMTRYHTDALPVVRGGDLLQIVTQADLLKLVGRMLQRNHSLQDARSRGQVAMANPVVQDVMNLVAEMGL